MTRAERRWCLLLSAALIVLTSIPYIAGFQAAGGEWSFTGFVFGVGDGNSYIAKMLQGQVGAWLFQTPYSSQTSAGVLAFLPYLVLGKLAAGESLHTQHVALFHLTRLGLIPVAVLAAYRFSSLFLPEPFWRRWATVLAVVGGGLGWLLALSGNSQLLGSLPLDFYSPEAFGFLALYGLPHLLMARSLLLFSLTAYLTKGGGVRPGLIAGLLLLGLGAVQPLAVVPAYAAFGAHLLVLLGLKLAGRSTAPLGPWARRAALAIVVSLPPVLYYAVGSISVPALQQWAAQNILPSPHPVHYLLAYALVLVPAILGARDLIRADASLGWFLPIWLIILLLLAYAPITVQRRLVEGAWVALSVLAARGLSATPIDIRRRRFLAGALLTVSLLTSMLLLGGGVLQAVRPTQPVFRPAAEVAAFEWIAEHASPNSVVLSAFDTGNALPAWAPVRSVIGHGPETANLAELQPEVERFFAGALTGSSAEHFLDEQSVSFVLRGPVEEGLGEWHEPPSDRLKVVYDEAGYAVYLVEPADD
jgi:hypothetical protein